MPFALKKALAMFLQPLPFLGLLLLLGVYLRGRGRKGWSLMLNLSSVMILFLISVSPITVFFMSRLENAWPPYQSNRVNATHIAVLGGYAGDDPRLAPLEKLSKSSLARVAEGWRLFRMGTDLSLIFSGGSFGQSRSMTDLYADAAESLGIPRKNMILLHNINDTEGEARAIKPVVGDAPFILVTSADHMKRAMLIFTTLGMNPIPAPADYCTRDSTAPRSLEYYLPCASSIEMAERLVHEYLGIIWFHLKTTIYQRESTSSSISASSASSR